MSQNQQLWTGRKVLRLFASLGIVGFGAYCTFVLGDDYSIGYVSTRSGLSATHFGYILMVAGTLGVFGVNIFRWGPLDARRDPPPEPDSIDSHW